MDSENPRGAQVSPLRARLESSFLGLGLLILLEVLCKNAVIPDYLFPAPSAMLASWQEFSQDYILALTATAVSSLLGLFLSVLVGSALALLFSLSLRLKNFALPLCIFFQTVPIIAIAPLMVIWFGFGRPTVVASSAVVSFFPILANTLLGLTSTSPGLNEVFSLLGASRWQRLLKLEIPYAVPQFLGGLRIAVGLAVVGALVGEFVGGGGLGGLIDSARTQQKMEIVFTAIFLSSGWGLFLIACLNGFSFTLKKYLFPR